MLWLCKIVKKRKRKAKDWEKIFADYKSDRLARVVVARH